jgi:hypothetical protein
MSSTALKTKNNWDPGFALELTDAQKQIVIERVTVGDKLEAICAGLGIWRHAFSNYLIKDPFFAKQYALARANFLEDHVERLFTIADDCTNLIDVGSARVKSDNIKWIAAKWKPEVYGENLNLNVNHSLDLSSVLLAAENRVLPILEAKAALRVDAIASRQNEIVVESNPTSSFVEEMPEELRDLI